MKPLYYAATAGHRVAPALSTQVYESLRPYLGYLKSALAAARRREDRSHCGSAPVPRAHTVRLAPCDAVLSLEPSAWRYRVEGWTGPPPTMPMFVGADFRPVRPAATPSKPKASSNATVPVAGSRVSVRRAWRRAGRS